MCNRNINRYLRFERVQTLTSQEFHSSQIHFNADRLCLIAYRKWMIFLRETTFTEKRSNLKEKNPSKGVDGGFFSCRIDTFSEGDWCKKSKQEATKVVSLLTNGRKSISVCIHLKRLLPEVVFRENDNYSYQGRCCAYTK